MMIFSLIAQIKNPAVTGLAGKGPDAAGELFGKFISSMIGLFLAVATIYAFLQFLQGAFQWISSGGDKTNLEGAQNRMTNSVLGLLIVASAWAVYLLITNFLGISALGVLPTLL